MEKLLGLRGRTRDAKLIGVIGEVHIKQGSEGQNDTGKQACSRAVLFNMVPVTCGNLHLKLKNRNIA